MKTLPVTLDDELDAALEAACLEKGLVKAQLVVDLLRKYLEAERLKRALQDPELISLYEELAPDDVSLAEEGMDSYREILESADWP